MAGSIAWSPTAFGSSLVFWLRSDLGLTVTGAGVSSWLDQSGQGDANRNATQGTDANRPIYTASDANYGGKPSVSAGGAARAVVTGIWNTVYSQPNTVFCAGKPNVNSGRMYDGSSGAGPREACAGDGGFWAMYAGAAFVDGTTGCDTRAVCCCLFNGVTSSIYVGSPAAPQNTASAGTDAMDRLGILNTLDLAVGATAAEIVEVFVVNKLCSAAEITSGMNYLKARYGL